MKKKGAGAGGCPVLPHHEGRRFRRGVGGGLLSGRRRRLVASCCAACIGASFALSVLFLRKGREGLPGSSFSFAVEEEGQSSAPPRRGRGEQRSHQRDLHDHPPLPSPSRKIGGEEGLWEHDDRPHHGGGQNHERIGDSRRGGEESEVGEKSGAKEGKKGAKKRRKGRGAAVEEPTLPPYVARTGCGFMEPIDVTEMGDLSDVVCCEGDGEGCRICPSSPWVEVAAVTADVAQGCDVVAFTSIFLSQGESERIRRQSFGNILNNDLLESFWVQEGREREEEGGGAGHPALYPQQSLCMVAIVSDTVGAHLETEARVKRNQKGMYPEWTTIALKTDETNMRRKSRLVKLLPHLFFPNASYVVFMDSKRKVRADPRTIIAQGLVAQSASFTACWHPYAARKPMLDRSEEWLFKEADIILESNKTSEVEKFQTQIELYRQSEKPLWMYMEGDFYACDMQSSFARKLLSQWFLEYQRGADRDQPAFAYTLGSMEGPLGPSRVFLAPPEEGFRWCRASYVE